MFIDQELQNIINDRITQISPKVVVLSSGITSSGLGDERNLREFLLSEEITNYLRSIDQNVVFYLFDDSFDPLTFAQLRVGVKKDELLIKKFEKYCGIPVKMVPDPYECHKNYSSHFQNEILNRFHRLKINPTLIDVGNLYEKGLYDKAKKIVFESYNQINAFLKEKFPNYTMKSIFSPLCSKCSKLDATEIKKVEGNYAITYCNNCKKRSRLLWRNLRGKFSWKVDTAIKWNLFKPDFEPYTNAYLDPDVGSYYIAKALSEEFFGGYAPIPLHIGKVSMDRELSYSLIPSCPRDMLNILFLEDRKRDMHLSEKKIVSIAKKYILDGELSYFDYVCMRLPYDIIQSRNMQIVDLAAQDLINHGNEFSRIFLKKNLQPALPTREKISKHNKNLVNKVNRLIKWVIEYKLNNVKSSHDEFLSKLNTYLLKNKINRADVFPVMRLLWSIEEGIPLSRIFHFVPNEFFYETRAIINKHNKYMKKGN